MTAGNVGAVDLVPFFCGRSSCGHAAIEFYGGVVVVEFHNGLPGQPLRQTGQFFQAPAAGDGALAGLRAMPAVMAPAALRPTFTRGTVLRDEGDCRKRGVGGDLPDLTLFLSIPVPDYHVAAALLQALRDQLAAGNWPRHSLGCPYAMPTTDLSTTTPFRPAATNGC